MSLQLRLSRLFAFSTLATITAWAQTGGIGNPGEAPGTPAQSYALSGIDHVNYLNGNLDVSIPVLAIGGRGGASSAVSVPIERHWTADNSDGVYSPGTNNWPTLAPAYALGDLYLSPYSANPYGCYLGGGSWAGFGPFTTNIVWTNGNGTQTILYDTLYNGEKKGADLQSCAQVPGYPYTNRGRTFRSMDGTDLTFVADADVYDGGAGGFISGRLITRDGLQTRFGPANTYPTMIEDRNGNQVQYSWTGTADGGIFTATDPVGRHDTINYTENLITLSHDMLTYNGYSGAPRTVTVNYDLLQNVLASGESLQTYHCLFPELSGSNSTNFNPYVVSSIQLADGTYYYMRYNAYGELAKLTLPTGAYYTYRYAEAGCLSNGNSGP